MHIRNWVKSPPFIMFYLTFLLPEACALLRQRGFAVDVRSLTFPPPWTELRFVVATRKG